MSSQYEIFPSTWDFVWVLQFEKRTPSTVKDSRRVLRHEGHGTAARNSTNNWTMFHIHTESERKDRIASELGLDPHQVAVWFQNRRARWKNKKLEEGYSKLKSLHEIVVLDKCRLEFEIGRYERSIELNIYALICPTVSSRQLSMDLEKIGVRRGWIRVDVNRRFGQGHEHGRDGLIGKKLSAEDLDVDLDK
ncbi:hypothetical protein J1N35_000606 [Gossypium stocksii]|uniref:Homeobox-leucine zipper protein n=1 Tax=Gossypium stocksii TaxID=47602 RepID=A0A9D4AKY6_9ROSI|nr:hypothetical protein J1N35_000606 [Gossypium stocksii]